MGAVGSGVALGFPFYFAYAFGAVALLPFAIFLIAGQMRKSGVSTVPDFFGQRFGTSVQLVAAIIVVLSMTFYMIPQLTASGLIGSYVLGIDYGTAVIFLGLGFTVYAALGGMWAISYTDLLQGYHHGRRGHYRGDLSFSSLTAVSARSSPTPWPLIRLSVR